MVFISKSTFTTILYWLNSTLHCNIVDFKKLKSRWKPRNRCIFFIMTNTSNKLYDIAFEGCVVKYKSGSVLKLYIKRIANNLVRSYKFYDFKSNINQICTPSNFENIFLFSYTTQDEAYGMIHIYTFSFLGHNQ